MRYMLLIYSREGARNEARAAYGCALAFVTNAAEREFLQGRIDGLDASEEEDARE